MAKPWKKSRALPDAGAVIAGRVAVDAETLVRLVHAVNPTSRELSRSERARRYELKSRLQSLLVRRFRDEIDVEPDAQRPEIALITHRSVGGDACHALIAQLDLDVRSWVQLQVDLGTSPDDEPLAAPVREYRSPARTNGESAMPRSPHERGLAALAEYDYETAKTELVRACRLAPDDPLAARDCLALLVDQLAADAEALELVAGLGATVRAVPEVVLFTALALARTGGDDELGRYLKQLEHHARAAEVCVAASVHAIARAELERAEAWRDELRVRDATHPELDSLHAAISQLRAARVRDDESALQTLEQEGADSDALIARARAVIEGFPESAVARRILRRIKAGERQARLQLLVTNATQALNEGDLGAALALSGSPGWAELPNTDRELLEQRVGELRQRRAEEQRRQAAETVVRLLSTDPQRSLAGYLELDPAGRALARTATAADATASELFDVLDAIGARASSPALAVAAALALRTARLEHADDPESALALLEPHERLLGRLAGFRTLRRVVHERELRKRLTAAQATLEEALSLEQAGDLQRAAPLLESLDLGALPASQRQTATLAQARVEHRRAFERLLTRARALSASGRLLDARRVLEAGLARADTDTAAAIGIELDPLRGEIQAEFRVEVQSGPFGLSFLRDFAWRRSVSAPAWLRNDRELVLAEAFAGRVMVCVVDLEQTRITSLVRLRTPEPMELAEVTLSAGSLWLSDSGGRLLRLRLDSWEVADWVVPRELVGDDVVEDSLVADGRWYWLVLRAPREIAERAVIYDLQKRSVRRELADVSRVGLAPTDQEPRVVCWEGTGTRLRKSSGAPVREIAPRLLSALAPHPAREESSWIALSDAELDEDAPLTIVDLSHDRDFPIEDSDGRLFSSLVVARAQRAAFVHFHDIERSRWVAAFDLDPGSARELWRVEVPDGIEFVRDAEHDDAFALVATVDGPVAVRLTRDWPLFPEAGLGLEWLEVAHARQHWYCVCDEDDAEHTDGELVERFRTLPPGAARAALAERLFTERAGDAIALWSVLQAQAATAVPGGEHIEKLRKRWQEAHADHAIVRLDGAGAAAADGDWRTVVDLLAHLDPAELPSSCRRHLHHALATAHIGTGNLAAARRGLDQARAFPGQCPLDQLGSVLDALEGGPEPALCTRAELASYRLVGAILAADRALDDSDPRAALEAIRASEILGPSEIQLLARRATAWLLLDSADLGEELEKTRALATFVDAQRGRGPLEVLLPAPWSPERLADLARQAEAWLSTGEQSRPVSQR